MDLQTMQEKLNNVKYSCDSELIADGLLVFQNCQQYNMEETVEYKAGVKLSKAFKKRALELGLPIDIEAATAIDDAQEHAPKNKRIVKKRKRQSL